MVTRLARIIKLQLIIGGWLFSDYSRIARFFFPRVFEFESKVLLFVYPRYIRWIIIITSFVLSTSWMIVWRYIARILSMIEILFFYARIIDSLRSKIIEILLFRSFFSDTAFRREFVENRFEETFEYCYRSNLLKILSISRENCLNEERNRFIRVSRSKVIWN